MSREAARFGEQEAGGTTPRFSPGDALGLFLRGVAMGAADIIPGVSGGTIAFISGVYERFIAALRSLSPAFLASLARGRVGEARQRLLAIHWAVLVPLGAGVALAIVTMSRLITGLMENHPGPTYAFFFGLIIASAWIPFARMRRRTWRHAAAATLAAVGAFLFVGLRSGGAELVEASRDPGAVAVVYAQKLRAPETAQKVALWAEQNAAGGAVLPIVLFDPNAVTADASLPSGAVVLESDEALEAWVAQGAPAIVLSDARLPLALIFLCGAVAISAMILPGLSGAFLLLFLGQYHAVLSAIHGVTGGAMAALGGAVDPLAQLAGRAWWQDFVFLGVFGLGVLAGLALFSRVVGWLFEHRHDVTMAALTGMMIGALRQPAQVVFDASASSDRTGAYWMVVIGVAVVGAAVVTGLGIADSWARSRQAGAATS